MLPGRRGQARRSACDIAMAAHIVRRAGAVGNRRGQAAGAYTEAVSIPGQPAEPGARVYPPEGALRCARPLPRREDLVIEDVPGEEWAAFQEALTRA